MSTEIARQAERPVLAMLTKYQGQIEAVLPKHLTPTRVLKMIVGAINKTPQLLSCTPMSVINAVLTASQLGLEIGPGSAYLVPFGKDCTLLIDYRGKIDLAIRSGKVLDVDLEVVYSREKFRIYRDGNGKKCIEHEPMLYKTDESGEHLPITEKDRGVPIGAYALAILKDGPPKIVFMPAIDLDAIRKRSKMGDGGAWKTDTMEMWKKTVAHRICKTLPMSAEKADQMRMAQEVDDRFEMGESLEHVIDIEPEDDVPMLAAGAGSAPAAAASAAKVQEIGDKLHAAAQPPAASNVTQMPNPPDIAPWSERKGMTQEFLKMKAIIGDAEMNRILSAHSIMLGSAKADDPDTLKCFRAMEVRAAQMKDAPAPSAPSAGGEKPRF
jgi:recombination protein RecT